MARRGLRLLVILIVASVSRPSAGDSYWVYPLPDENPVDACFAQVPVVDPAEVVASPFAWHDVDGEAGGEFTDTRGNNVFAQTDPKGHNNGTFRPDGDLGGPMLEFAFLHDPELEPEEGTNPEAAVTHLFYLTNVFHDLTYGYGFDEVAGNFQENNYGCGGLGEDPVYADAQDGGCANCAMIGVLPDGFSPRMNISTWVPLIDSRLTVLVPPRIAGDYLASSAEFGEELDEVGWTGDLELVNDGSGSTRDGCEPLIGFTPGNVALIERGSCEFAHKVLGAETAGASAAIVFNDREGLLHMGRGTDGSLVTIPSILIRQEDGAILLGELDAGVTATLRDDGTPDRDGALDSGIVSHHLGHGISERLVGGPSSTSCLTGAEQPSEGWSDFWSLVLTAKPEDTAEQPRTIGSYVVGDPDGTGLRNYPYTTDLELNPLTYADVASINIPHGVGEVWMSMLWEIYWELVALYGFDPDFYRGTGGNNLMIQLVVDGMKLQACNPTFVDARDALLMADLVNHEGAHQCILWRGFAKRGLGVGASSGTLDVGDEVVDFQLPEDCEAVIFADGFESGDTSAWSS